MKLSYVFLSLLFILKITSGDSILYDKELSRSIRDVSNGGSKSVDNQTTIGADSSTNTKHANASKDSTKASSNETGLTGVYVIPSKHNPDLKKETKDNDDSADSSDNSNNEEIPGQPKFDENAASRALIVIAGLTVILIIYLGVKFMLLKKKKLNSKRYGRIDAELDLLDEIEDGETDEEEELFDVNATRRSQF